MLLGTLSCVHLRGARNAEQTCLYMLIHYCWVYGIERRHIPNFLLKSQWGTTHPHEDNPGSDVIVCEYFFLPVAAGLFTPRIRATLHAPSYPSQVCMPQACAVVN